MAAGMPSMDVTGNAGGKGKQQAHSRIEMALTID
jgi:hypothetical protein